MVAIIHPEINFIWGTLFICLTVLFSVLCWLVKDSTQFVQFEERLQTRFIHQQNHWWWQLIAIVFDPKTVVLWDFILAFFLLWMGRWPRAIFVLGALGTVDAFGIAIKHYIKRQRPEAAVQRATYSFPSGHTLGTTMMMLMITTLFTSPWIIGGAVVAWLLVIICRLTLQAHYPADVLGAVILAVVWWIGAEFLYLLIMR